MKIGEGSHERRKSCQEFSRTFSSRALLCASCVNRIDTNANHLSASLLVLRQHAVMLSVQKVNR
jgi:hypothetical protein